VRVCDFDFAQMRPLGYDAIRLNLSWSLLEPQPGRIDSRYLDRIAQVVGWARAAGIYVVLDMHQDAWSKYLYSGPYESCFPPMQRIQGFDGAPLWASAHVAPVCALNGVRELDPAVQEDFQRLWTDAPGPDGVGLQEHYANAVTALARRFAGDPAVAGYEIINEPSPGYAAGGPGMDASELFPFYGKVVNTVVARVPNFRQLFFVEPDATRNVTDQRAVTTPWSLYSGYRNVVYAPHIYTWVFTADVEATGKRTLPFDGGYRNAVGDAQQLDLPLWVGEFGNNPSDDDTILTGHYQLQDRYLLGGTLWLWKENANDTNPQFFWGVYGPPFGAGTPQPKRIALTSRAYPIYTAGTLRSLSYDRAQASFDIRGDSRPVGCGDRSHATVVFVPHGSVAVSGARAQIVGHEAFVYPNGGSYRVFSGPGAAPGCPVLRGGSAVLISPRRTAAGCYDRRRFTFRIVRPRHGRVVAVTVYVNGRRVRRVRGRSVGRVSITRLPVGRFTVKIVARTSRGGRVVTINRYTGCGQRRVRHRHRRRHRRRPPGTAARARSRAPTRSRRSTRRSRRAST
jgi:endoglycosylceramidase